LVLVRTKFHTVALEEFLNKRPELIKHQISVGHLTGQGSAEELGLPGTQQATVLKEFRKGTKSLLVATGKSMKFSRTKSQKCFCFCRCCSGRIRCS
jgi:ERCC4-related helicase